MDKDEFVDVIMGLVIAQSRGLLGGKYALNVDLNELRKGLSNIWEKI